MRAWVVLGAVGCARPPHVVSIETAFFPLEDAGDVAALGASSAEGLLHDLARGRLVEVQLQGHTAGEADLLALPPEVAFAAYGLTIHPRATEHIDLLLPIPGGLERPLSLRIDRRVLRLEWVALRPRPEPGPVASEPSREVVVRRFGLGAIEDGDVPWREGELALLDEALAHVEPEGIELLRGVPFVRRSASPRAAARELAWFEPRTEPPRVEVYDLAFAPSSGAVGPTDALLPLPVMTLVHEIGHALADAPLRRAWLEGAPAGDRALLRRGGPVIQGWRRARDHRSPTPYGRRNAHESFAEAYALHRLDPAALAEVMPEGAAWFAAGEHLRLAGLKAAPE